MPTHLEAPRLVAACAAIVGSTACAPAPSPARAPTELEVPATPASAPALVVAGAPDPPGRAERDRDPGIAELPCAAAGRIRSLTSETSLHVDFVNDTSVTLSLLWIDFQGGLVHYADLPSGESYRQQTYVTHPWVALDRDRTCHGVFLPKAGGLHTVVIGPR